jgi:cyclic beta-1,2-glucan synthetase
MAASAPTVANTSSCRPGDATPAPWANVLANPHFGTVISESGGAYTWAENAHEFRLTPWHNDPVGDASGEAIYLRDEETGQVWSPTPLPARGTGEYVTRHGFGYSVFEHVEDGIYSELWVYVALDASVKFSVLKLRNDSGRRAGSALTGYVEWVLGDLREKTACTWSPNRTRPAARCLRAMPTTPSSPTAWRSSMSMIRAARASTGDRSEFLGRNGSTAFARRAEPHASVRPPGRRLDPCAAFCSDHRAGRGRAARGRVPARPGARYRRRQRTGAALPRQHRAAEALNKVRALAAHAGRGAGRTPDPALDVLANGWLLYQTIACRLWARSGYYQSGGAFGFRDQLQDSMALCTPRPTARAQLLLCARTSSPKATCSTGGIRRRIAACARRVPTTTCGCRWPLCRYVLATGDRRARRNGGFIEGRPLHPGEESYYDLPQHSSLRETLYEHCVRAIEARPAAARTACR